MKNNQWLTILKEKKPGLMIICGIALFNLLFIALFSFIISLMNGMPYFEAMFNVLAMMFDPGCISGVVDGKGQVALCIVCFVVVIVGLIVLTGAVIGYVSNMISDFISKANNGKNRLNLENHTVILNWNDRGLEIINEYLLLERKEVIVVFSEREREAVQKQIDDTLSLAENKGGLKNKITVIVRSGNVFSTQQLKDISLDKAKTVVILEEDACRVQNDEDGNGQTIKTLMQVVEIASKRQSKTRQKVVIEVNDDWTEGVVKEILSCKNETEGDIVPVAVNQLFGNIFTQFAITPKLNAVYSELFSNEGVEFYTKQTDFTREEDFFLSYVKDHSYAIPLTVRDHKGKKYAYFIGKTESDMEILSAEKPVFHEMSLAKNFQLKSRRVVVLGHNKNLVKILEGLKNFNDEWRQDKDLVSVLILDDKENIEKHGGYPQYPFIEECIAVDIHDKDVISRQLLEHFDGQPTTVLILSSENVPDNEKDLNALANLIYLQSALNKKNDENFDAKSVDIVVEIIEPEHHDIVQNYSKSNVVISNKYVSKIIMQLAEKDALYDFYKEILTFDIDGVEGKEIYLKGCSESFTAVPEKMPVRDFIYSMYENTLKQNGKGEVAIGYVDENSNINFFYGDMTAKYVELTNDCSLIVFSDH